MQTHAPHVRHVRETLLSDNWYTLKKYTFELLRRDGRWQGAKPGSLVTAATARSFYSITVRSGRWS